MLVQPDDVGPSRRQAITAQLLDVLAAWPVGAITSVTTPELGAMHETVFVETEAGQYVLRGYRPRTRQWVEAEHAVLDFVARHSIPAPAPFAC
jgi:Ser/Thr protein kinase RdoA (MazF antagonist)